MDDAISSKVILHLQDIVNNMIFCLTATDDKKMYPQLTEAQIASKTRGLCCAAVVSFLSRMEKENVPAIRLFLVHEPFTIRAAEGAGFNVRFLNSICNHNFIGASDVCRIVSLSSRCSRKRQGHTLVEVRLGKEWFVADPTAGLLYCVGKEDLLRGKGIYESYLYMNQAEALATNIQINNRTLLYASPVFWENVYRVSYVLEAELEGW